MYSARPDQGKRSTLELASHGVSHAKKPSLRSDGGADVNLSATYDKAEFIERQSERTIGLSSELSKVKTLTNL